MLRSMLLVSCLLACCGCTAAHKSLTASKDDKEAAATINEAPATVKDYKYKDLSNGSSAFYRH